MDWDSISYIFGAFVAFSLGVVALRNLFEKVIFPVFNFEIKNKSSNEIEKLRNEMREGFAKIFSKLDKVDEVIADNKERDHLLLAGVSASLLALKHNNLNGATGKVNEVLNEIEDYKMKKAVGQ